MALYSKSRKNDGTNGAPKIEGKPFVRLIVLLLLALLPILCMVVQNAISLNEATTQKSEGQVTNNEIVFTNELVHVVHDILHEREYSSWFITSDGDTDIYQSLLRLYDTTDETIRGLSRWLEHEHPLPPNFITREVLLTHLAHHRGDLWFRSNETSFAKEMRFYVDINWMFIHVMMETLTRADSSQLWTTIVAFQMLIQCNENIDVERNLGKHYFDKGGFTTDELVWYYEVNAIAGAQLTNAIIYGHSVGDVINDFLGTPLEKELNSLRQEIKENKLSKPSPEKRDKWMKVMEEYLEVLEAIEIQLSDQVIESVERILHENNVRLSTGFSVLIVVACIGPVIVLGVYKMASESQAVAANLEKVTANLADEQRKSDKLLYSVFPSIIVESMKKATKVPAEYYDQATIMYSDVVGFTEGTASLSPHKIIDLLNRMDQAFDAIFNRYDVYKLETGAGSYMVASGLPTKNGDQHAEQIACAALHLLAAARAFHPMHIPYPMEFRIGIHTGPCVAGVVGEKRPRYYVFGSTVSTAQSLEKTSEPRRIQISSSTAELLKSSHLDVFDVKPRGEVTIKDGVKMKTFWLSEAQSRKTSHTLSTHEMNTV